MDEKRKEQKGTEEKIVMFTAQYFLKSELLYPH